MVLMVYKKAPTKSVDGMLFFINEYSRNTIDRNEILKNGGSCNWYVRKI